VLALNPAAFDEAVYESDRPGMGQVEYTTQFVDAQTWIGDHGD
jgi:hypothetical protein